ncbi:MAG TPA: hypothetical protein VNG51_19590 [Ktedonobacteraceae bacterium]|nr:hypothetical protein [Ktedonobacteraceae bacterium]
MKYVLIRRSFCVVVLSLFTIILSPSIFPSLPFPRHKAGIPVDLKASQLALMATSGSLRTVIFAGILVGLKSNGSHQLALLLSSRIPTPVLQ